MEYKIKEIAELFGLSKQMIRYYEQCGVIHPKRVAENNYRIYNAMDYFALAEAVSLSKFNVNITDIYAVKKHDYNTKLSDCYRSYIEEVKNELSYKNLLKTRAEELLARIENAELNIGNIWIKRIPAHRMYPLLKSHDDTYEQVNTPLDVRERIHSSDALPFGDGMFEMNDGYDQWWTSFHKSYVDALQLPQCKESLDVIEQYCICVIINMGNVGEFKTDMIRKTLSQIHEMDYEFVGKARALLLCRGSKGKEFRRLLELQVPIKKP